MNLRRQSTLSTFDPNRRNPPCLQTADKRNHSPQTRPLIPMEIVGKYHCPLSSFEGPLLSLTEQPRRLCRQRSTAPSDNGWKPPQFIVNCVDTILPLPERCGTRLCQDTPCFGAKSVRCIRTVSGETRRRLASIVARSSVACIGISPIHLQCDRRILPNFRKIFAMGEYLENGRWQKDAVFTERSGQARNVTVPKNHVLGDSRHFHGEYGNISP